MFNRTRSLKEINAELAKLASNRDAVDFQYQPQLNFQINLKIEILNVLKWYLKDKKSAPTLGHDNDNLKRHANIVKQQLEKTK